MNKEKYYKGKESLKKKNNNFNLKTEYNLVLQRVIFGLFCYVKNILATFCRGPPVNLK